MSPNTGCFVCSIFLLWIPVIQGTYFVSGKSSNWGGDKDCAFANPPPINFTEKKLTVQVNDLNTTEVGNVWIGYFKKKSGFEYTGCVSFNDTNFWRQISKEISEPNPGKCYSACKYSDIIGVTENKCYCAENDLPTTLVMTYPHCTLECESLKGVACGGTEDGTLYISLYRFSLNVTVANHLRGKLGNCLSFEPKNKYWYWKECFGTNSILLKMCVRDDKVYAVTNAWNNSLDTVVSCFRNRSMPTTYQNSKLVPVKQGANLWTGIIRSHVIYQVAVENIPKTSDIEYGYLKRKGNSNTYELKFEKEDKEERRYICFETEPTRQSTSTTSRKSTTSSITTSSITTTSEISSAMTTPTTTTSILSSRIDSTEAEVTPSSGTHSTPLTDISAGTKAAVSGEQAGDSGDSEVGAVIGASVVSVLVVIAVVVVVVILKRRKKLPFLCKEAVPAKEFGYQQPKRKIDEISRENHDYDHANVDSTNTVNTSSDSNYAHTYFVLEPHVNESNTDNTTYDTSGNANKTITEPDNVYNRLKTDNNQTYDHAHTKIRNGVLKFDDTYDTTDKVAMKLKARPGKDSDAFGETDEDAYNHITSKPVTNTKTENEYGVPNTLENAYGDVGANNKNNTHDKGDTYSHINKKPQNKEKQSNPFSKSKQIHDSKMSEGNQDADYDVTDRDGKLLTADNDYSTIGTVH